MLHYWVSFQGPLLGRHEEIIITVFQTAVDLLLVFTHWSIAQCPISGTLCYANTAENSELQSCCPLCQCWSGPQQILICILLSFADTGFICCKASSEAALCLINTKERERHRSA